LLKWFALQSEIYRARNASHATQAGLQISMIRILQEIERRRASINLRIYYYEKEKTITDERTTRRTPAFSCNIDNRYSEYTTI